MNFLYKTEQAKRDHLKKLLVRWYPDFQNGGQIYRDQISEQANLEAVVLDAGCGDGGILTQYKHLFHKLVGLDNDQNLLDKNKYIDEKICANLSRIPLSDESIDLISSDFVLEHVQNPDLVFQEIARVLKPGGTFLFRTTNVYNPIMLLSKFLPLFTHKILREKILKKEEGTHETFYRANQWKKLVDLGKKSGFTSIQLLRAGNPEYLAFSPLTSHFAILLEKGLNVPGFRWLKMYLIGIYKK